jgi:hypothetical protein
MTAEPYRFIACDAMIGFPRQPLEAGDASADDLERDMARLNVRAAIVRHRFCLECSPSLGNRILMDEVRGRPNLIPAWALTPDGEEPEFDPAEAVRRMLASGARAAWICPKRHSFSVESWCSGALYAALQDARVPLLLDWNGQTPDQLHGVLEEFPGLRAIILNPSREGRDRLLFPLLKRHANLRLCLSPVYTAHELFVELAQRFGPGRWVFGTGFPESEGGAGVTGLLYSGLPEQVIRAAATENIERLLAEVRA